MKTIRTLINHYHLTAFFVPAIVMPWLFAPLVDAIFYSGLPKSIPSPNQGLGLKEGPE